MRITFANDVAARDAARILEQYGYSATPTGSSVETDCPTLLGVPVVGRAVGLDQIEQVQLAPPRLPRAIAYQSLGG
jgi:hypothetical protein